MTQTAGTTPLFVFKIRSWHWNIYLTVE